MLPFAMAAGSSCSIRARMASIAEAGMPPSGTKNLKPLRSEGWWLAVIMIEAWARGASPVRLLYIAGVVHRPKSSTFRPCSAMPLAQALSRLSPVRRESRPSAIVSSEGLRT